MQTAICWIATVYLAAALFLGRTLRSDEPKWLAPCNHLLFAAFALVIGGSLLGEWLGIAVFYVPALFIGAKSNYTVVDTWRFWIIHLWVEGFFEFFATTIVALRVIYLHAILYFLGGLMGTGHHRYFTGQSNATMAVSAIFSVLEVVPLTLLTLDAWDFIRTERAHTIEWLRMPGDVVFNRVAGFAPCPPPAVRAPP